jgi:hypothetical protein
MGTWKAEKLISANSRIFFGSLPEQRVPAITAT